MYAVSNKSYDVCTVCLYQLLAHVAYTPVPLLCSGTGAPRAAAAVRSCLYTCMYTVYGLLVLGQQAP